VGLLSKKEVEAVVRERRTLEKGKVLKISTSL